MEIYCPSPKCPLIILLSNSFEGDFLGVPCDRHAQLQLYAQVCNFLSINLGNLTNEMSERNSLTSNMALGLLPPSNPGSLTQIRVRHL